MRSPGVGWPTPSGKCLVELGSTAMATLASVNVGLPAEVPWKDRIVYTGAWKTPVEGPRMVRRLNIDGDGQGDLGGHGGENRAVLVYQLDSYRHWMGELDRDLHPGDFGENFTVDGLPDDEVCIGDRYQIGEALLEVTQQESRAIDWVCASMSRGWPLSWSRTVGPDSIVGYCVKGTSRPAMTS